MKNLLTIFWATLLISGSSLVQAQCNANYEMEIDSTGFGFQFNPSTFTAGTTYFWDFGDGDTSIVAAPFHKYSKPGRFEVCLTITNANSLCKDTFCDSVLVGDPCWRKIYFNFEYGQLNARAQNRNFGATYTWFFGDSDSAKGKAILHNYSKNGTYNVCLRVDDLVRKCSREMCFNLNAQWDYCEATCEGGLGSDSTHMTMSHVVRNNKNLLRTWKVNGFIINGETGPQLKYPVQVDSAYVFCLETFDTLENCRDTFCLDAFVPSNNCRADFTYVKDLNTYSFSPSYGRAKKVFWDFGNGETSTIINPTVQLSDADSSQVCLTVYCDNGDSVTSCITIHPNNSCEALYTIALDTNQKFKLFLWNKSSKSSSMSYSWDFGDGSSSNDRNPKHVYANYGAYTICLTISDNSIQCKDTYCDTVGIDSTGKLLKSGFELVVFDDDLIFNVQEKEPLSFKMYPNPAKNILYLPLNELELTERLDVELINLQGLVLKSISTSDFQAKLALEMNDIPSGMYYVRLQSQDRIFTPKLIQVIK